MKRGNGKPENWASLWDVAANLTREAAEVNLKADEILERNDIDGRLAWLRIVEPIKELERHEAPDGALGHWCN